MTGILSYHELVNSLVLFTFYGYACGSGRVQELRNLAGRVGLRFFRVWSGRKIWTHLQL